MEPEKPQRARRQWLVWGVFLAALGAIVVSSTPCLSQLLPTLDRPAPGPTGQPAPVVKVVPRGDLTQSEKTTIEIFRKVAPSVVFITRLQRHRDWFRRNVMEIPSGTGSGFLWDRKGHVVTNFHVVQGAHAARVTLADGSVWKAALVGYYADKDVAVLRIDAPTSKLQPVSVGTSDDLVVGQYTYAIGNPFGLDHTLSTGVVSGLGREIMSANRRPIQGVIQTDAAINPGNSGGPLLDSAGRVIGVNTAIYSPSGASAGIGFAVPIDAVRRIVPQLIESGRVTRPGLGVQVDDGRIVARLGLDGALIVGVVPGSGAEKAGVEPTRIDPQTGSLIVGDVIVELAGETIDNTLDLYRVLDRHKVGETVPMVVVRKGKRIRLNVELMAVADE